MHQGGVWFVTRVETNSYHELIQVQTASGPVLANQIMVEFHPGPVIPSGCPGVHYQDPDTGKEYVFLTNRLDLSALQVAEQLNFVGFSTA